MELVGSIPYTTLEEGVETEWDALFVYKVGDSFYFRNSCHLPPEIKEELPDLASCMQKVVHYFYQAYFPLFEKEYFELLTTEIVCQRTFFERSDAFRGTHDCYDDTEGIFYG